MDAGVPENEANGGKEKGSKAMAADDRFSKPRRLFARRPPSAFGEQGDFGERLEKKTIADQPMLRGFHCSLATIDYGTTDS